MTGCSSALELKSCVAYLIQRRFILAEHYLVIADACDEMRASGRKLDFKSAQRIQRMTGKSIDIAWSKYLSHAKRCFGESAVSRAMLIIDAQSQARLF